MLCPRDQNELRLAERQGVEIDYCPQCRGVWLDRGELDKILDREAADLERGDRVPIPPFARDRLYGHRDHDRDDDDDWNEHSGRRRRRRGWLNDLFEFGG
jgi:Zn-finger nucleic acid-binding protein